MRLKPPLHLGLPKPDRGAQLETGQPTRLPPVKHGRRRQSEILGEFASGKQPVRHTTTHPVV